MQTLKNYVLALCLLSGFTNAVAAPVAVTGVRAREAPDRTRLVFDLTAPADYRAFSIAEPDRLVIDITEGAVQGALHLSASKLGLVEGLRHARRADGGLRIVLDLNEAVSFNNLTLPPNGPYGHRLVIDLKRDRGHGGAVVRAPRVDGDIVVVVDAGHGGEDPGAVGARGTLEKDVTLAIAQELATQINALPGMRAVLTRDRDYYIGLRERMERGRSEMADLFISIHADAFQNRKVHGASVYVLSQRGASSEAARWLAEKENASDVIGGIPLSDKDAVLQTVLLNMSQAAQIRTSRMVADEVLHALREVGPVHRKDVQHAGFLVLKSPDVPSLLVETAFISNPTEERKLADERHQRRVAEAIMRGVVNYFHAYPPHGRQPPPLPTLAADQEHRVRRGETLSLIAARYDVSTERLRLANELESDRINAGDTLRIP